MKHIKLILLGESGTGKTCIAYRLLTYRFMQETESTIGAAFFSRVIGYSKFDIWDTAGQERYLALTKLYYHGTDIFILVYDLYKPETIIRLKYYMDKITEDYEIKKDILILIIGNKLDLILEQDISNLETKIKSIIEPYKKYKIIYLNLSAKTNHNFDLLENYLMEYGNSKSEPKPENIINITDKPNKTNFCFCF